MWTLPSHNSKMIDMAAADSRSCKGKPAECEDIMKKNLGSKDPDTDLLLNHTPDRTAAEPEIDGKKKGLRVNMHFVLLGAVVLFIAIIAYRLLHFGNFVSQEDIFSDGQGIYEAETFDEIAPLMDGDQHPIPLDYSDGLTILAFGNAPLADDRDSENGLANIIARQTGANVINCAVSNSCLAAQHFTFDAGVAPMDAYTFYWMCLLASGFEIDQHFSNAAAVLGEDLPPDAEEAYNNLKNVDMDTVDAILIMYDASDYLRGNSTYDPQNLTNIRCFAGNMAAGIELIQKTYPHIRIIIMSPTYAYAVDDNGKYISSEKKSYGGGFLSDYHAGQYMTALSQNVTFVDNLFGTFTEENAEEYLTDNLHLNEKGRQAVADRFTYALTYYNNLALPEQ